MQQHNARKRSGNGNGYNANSRIPESAISSVKSITDRLHRGEFSSDYLRESFLSKYCDETLTPARERRSAAIKRWRDQERLNARTNDRLRGMDRGYNILPRVTFYRFLGVVQALIGNVLGDLNDEIVLGSFSGGASTGRRRKSSSPAEKFVGMADATQDAIPYVDLIHRQSALYRQYGTFYSLREVEGAVLFTVPKKTDIDRCACKEPEINMFLQKGVGRHIRSRLRKVGINLNDQRLNREYARVGSIDSSLATLDLSSASDSVTIQCVRALLPTDWFLYLNDIRSKRVVIDGEITETEMFSSMGNGFTFELESLIFWALMKATAYLRGHRGIISVYGDDIIIPSGMNDDAVWILSEFGFTVNPEKSFSEGPFRESCGGHYYLGRDVTPFYLRSSPDRLTDLIRICNQLRRWLHAEPGREYEQPDLVELWFELARYIPSRLWGGCDLEVDTQLASPGVSKDRLSRFSFAKELPVVGSYLQWHTSMKDRSSEGIINAQQPVETTQRCRFRRAKSGTLALDLWFRQEL